jgi:hypothetical protein
MVREVSPHFAAISSFVKPSSFPLRNSLEIVIVQGIHPAFVLLLHLSGELGSQLAGDDLLQSGGTVFIAVALYEFTRSATTLYPILIPLYVQQLVNRDANQQSPQPMAIS